MKKSFTQRRGDAKKNKKEEKEKYFKVVSFVLSNLTCLRTRCGKLFASPRLCEIFFSVASVSPCLTYYLVPVYPG